MDRKIKKHEELCEEIHLMYIKKNADYGDSVGELYSRLGDVSFLTRISDKYNRLMNLMCDYDGYMRSDINYESVDDTIMDLANYCIIWLMERELKNNQEELMVTKEVEEDKNETLTSYQLYRQIKNKVNK